MKKPQKKTVKFLRVFSSVLFAGVFFFATSMIGLGLSADTVKATGDGEPTVLNIEDGNIFFDLQIKIEFPDGTSTVLTELDPDGYKIIGSSQENTIQINNWHDPVGITLENMSASHLHITPESSVTITLSGKNSFTSETVSAIDHLGDRLTINGTENDSLLLKGTNIINSSGTGKSVIINGGNITANAQNAGIVGTSQLTVNDGNLTLSTENADGVVISASEIKGGTVNINGRIGSGFKVSGGTVNISAQSIIQIFNQDAEITGGSVNISQLHSSGRIFHDAKKNLIFTGGNVTVTNANSEDRILFPVELYTLDGTTTYFASISDAISAAMQLSEPQLTVNRDFTINTDMTLPSGFTMVISDGVVLTLSDDAVFTNKGTVRKVGMISGNVVCENHHGGNATCTALAKCSLCSAEYGELLPHPFSDKWSVDKDHHYRVCTYQNCDEVADKAKHSYSNIFDSTCIVCSSKRTPIATSVTFLAIFAILVSALVFIHFKTKAKEQKQ